MCRNIFGIDNNLLEELKPFLNGLELSTIHTLASYINTGSFEEYTERVMCCSNKQIRVFYDSTATIVEDYMRRC